MIKYTPESLNKKTTEVEQKLDKSLKKMNLDLALMEISYFYGNSALQVEAGTIWAKQYNSQLNMIIKCLKNNRNRTRTVKKYIGPLQSILGEYEELTIYQNVFEYHNILEIEEMDDFFIHHIPIEMSEVDAKRVISDWLEKKTPNLFISPTDQSLEKVIKNADLITVEGIFGYNYDDLKRIEEILSDYFVRHAIEDFQKSKGRKFTREDMKEHLGEIGSFPLIFFKNRFKKRLKELKIENKYYEALLLPVSQFKDYENVLNNFPFKGAFIELDSFRFITSFWWYRMQSGLGLRSFFSKNIDDNTFDKLFENDTRQYMQNLGFSTFKINKPIEIDGIGTLERYFLLIENLNSYLPIDIRNAYLKSIDSTIQGRIGKRFLKKFIQIDKRYNWAFKEGLEYLKGNPHHKKACLNSDIILPIIFTPDKEMLPDKVGRTMILNRQIFGYLINKIPHYISSTKKTINNLEIIFLPLNIYGLISNSAFLPRIGRKTIILPDIFQNEDLYKIVGLHEFIYQWEYKISDLDDSFSMNKLLDDLDYSNSKDVILLAIISTALRDIFVVNKLLQHDHNKKNARYLLYILENIYNNLFDELESDDIEMDILSVMTLNFSNCKMSTFFDNLMIKLLKTKVNYPIDFQFPFIDNNFQLKDNIENKITERSDILSFSNLIFEDIFHYINNRKIEDESIFFRYIATQFTFDFYKSDLEKIL
jgi:hypothetical protein